MIRLKLIVGVTVCLLLTGSAFSGMPSRLHEFAQVGDGGGDALWMRTSFLIANQNLSDAAQITLRFYSDSGQPLPLPIAGTTTAVYTTMIPSEGSVKLSTAGRRATGSNPIGPEVGSATLSADVEVAAQVFFEIYAGNTLITQAAIEPMGPMSSVDIFVDYDVTGSVATANRTGYALANLSDSTPVDIGILLYPENGSGALWSYSFQLPARGHTARYLDEHFPALQTFRGTARITAGGSFTVTALQARGLLIGTLPPVRRPLYSRYGGQ